MERDTHELNRSSDSNQSNVCRSNDLSLNLLNIGVRSRTEMHDQTNGNDSLIAARTTTFGLLQWLPETRTDFTLHAADGSAKSYEEYPTPISSLDPAKADQIGPLYEYDAKTDTRGKALVHGSAEEKEANDALYQLRSKYTPKVILSLPACSAEHKEVP